MRACTLLRFIVACQLFIAVGVAQSRTELLDSLNVVWDSPSKDHHGSMPLGNGSIGLNAWIDEAGDVHFYIGRIDSFSEGGSLLKVGKIRVSFTPRLLAREVDFRQELNLKNGEMTASIDGDNPARIKVWVDANHPVIHVECDSQQPVSATAHIEIWREAPMAMDTTPGDVTAPNVRYIQPDVVMTGLEDCIGWYHYNDESFGPQETMQFQDLAGYPNFIDPQKDLTFGGIITAEGGVRVDGKTLATSPATRQIINVYCLAVRPSNPDSWLAEMNKAIGAAKALSYAGRYAEHVAWWRAFWDRSWIYITQNEDDERGDSASASRPAPSDAEMVSQAYALQRFINACAGRGRYPIKFNGSLFTVPHEGYRGDADYRRWGPGYWWQNTRLPYMSMCTSGDFDLMEPFIRMYLDDVLPLCEYRTQRYFGFDGAYIPECIYPWGAVFPQTYGTERPATERDDKLQTSGWHKWEWTSGYELVFMLLDYCVHTGDDALLKEKVLPAARSVARFFENYYETDDAGKLFMHPSQALETWWDCDNPMPDVAGLRAVAERILALPERLVTGDQRAFWRSFRAQLPELPLRDTPSGPALAPAARYADKRNIENPELYAVYPFRQIAFEKPNLEWGLNALERRWDQGAFGWRQDDLFMAYMGLAEQARVNVTTRARNHHGGSRFPAFWGPNYDWIPDQDHGGVLMKAVQALLLQTDGDTIYLLPAWPEDWDARFNLHAPKQTIVEAQVEDGRIVGLKVTPESREKDVVIVTSSQPNGVE